MILSPSCWYSRERLHTRGKPSDGRPSGEHEATPFGRSSYLSKYLHFIPERSFRAGPPRLTDGCCFRLLRRGGFRLVVDGLSPDEVEDHAALHLIVFEPVEDVVDRGQRLQLDIGLDFALGGQRQPAAISSLLPTKEPRMVMQFATTSNSAAARVQQRPRRRASDQRDELAPLHPSSFQPLIGSLSRARMERNGLRRGSYATISVGAV